MTASAPPPAAPTVVIDDARLAKASAYIEEEEGAVSGIVAGSVALTTTLPW